MPDAPISNTPAMLKPGWLADDVRKAAERVDEWTAPKPTRVFTARPRPALAFSSRDLTNGAITPAVRAAGATIAGAIAD